MPTEKCIATLAFIFWLSLLSGCGDPVIKTENPFRDAEQSIQAGRTTRTQVHEILGSPNIQYPSGEWDVYKKLGNGIGLISIIPYPYKDASVHYLLITYNKDGQVTAVGSGADWASKKGSVWEAWSGSGVYAGDVGFYTGTNQPFISVDQGGKADSAWVSYLRLLQHSQLTDRTSKHTVIRQLCRASSRAHPSAFNAIGKIYREGLYSIPKDNVMACFWYAMANSKVQPSWCDGVLAPEETSTVKQLVGKWQPDQCENELLLRVPEPH